MFEGFISRFKSRMLAKWFKEASGGLREDIKEIVVPGGRLYFVPDDGQEMPVITTMYKSLIDEDPPLPDRTKVVMIMAPAGSDAQGLKVSFVDEESARDDIPVGSLGHIAQEIYDLAIKTAGPSPSVPALDAPEEVDLASLPVGTVASVEGEAIFEPDPYQNSMTQDASAGSIGGDASQKPY